MILYSYKKYIIEFVIGNYEEHDVCTCDNYADVVKVIDEEVNVNGFGDLLDGGESMIMIMEADNGEVVSHYDGNNIIIGDRTKANKIINSSVFVSD